MALRRLGGGVRTELLCLDGTPMLIDGGERSKKKSSLPPTLAALWLVPRALPTLQIHPPVSKFIISGSDLMMPGCTRAADRKSRSPSGSTSPSPSPQPASHGRGRLLFDPSPPIRRRARGRDTPPRRRAVGGGQQVRPNEGFGDQLVAPTGPVEWPPAPPDEEEERKRRGTRKRGGRGGAGEGGGAPEPKGAGRRPAASSWIQGAQAAADARTERLDTLSQPVTAMRSWTRWSQPRKRRRTARMTAMISTALTTSSALNWHDGRARAGAGPEPRAVARTPEERTSSCSSASSRRRGRYCARKSLPLDAAIVYSGHMRKVRRAGTDLDVKRSSYKLLPFLQELQRRALIELKLTDGVATVVLISTGGREPGVPAVPCERDRRGCGGVDEGPSASQPSVSVYATTAETAGVCGGGGSRTGGGGGAALQAT